MNAKLFSEAMNEIDDKYVYKALTCQPKRKFHILPFAASLMVFVGICGFAFAVSVYHGVGSTNHIDFDQLTQPFGTIAKEQPFAEHDNELFYEKSELIDDYSDIFAENSVCVTIEDDQIPSIYFSPGYMVLFSHENEQGWTLNAGETLTLDLSLHRAQSLALETGYLLNGEYHILSLTKGCDFTETLTAPETGEYYFCVTNHSSSNAVIERGSITLRTLSDCMERTGRQISTQLPTE
ncbi:MAG: hypothetical protein K2N95_06950 [Lachnospiraceae bacterium]|nr:hypothetical protein [Lachnospiraceae bacterium]